MDRLRRHVRNLFPVEDRLRRHDVSVFPVVDRLHRHVVMLFRVVDKRIPRMDRVFPVMDSGFPVMRSVRRVNASFFLLAAGPHPRRELTLSLALLRSAGRRRFSLAAGPHSRPRTYVEPRARLAAGALFDSRVRFSSTRVDP